MVAETHTAELLSLDYEAENGKYLLTLSCHEGEFSFYVDDVDLYRLAQQATKAVERRMDEEPNYGRFILSALSKRAA